MAYISIDDFRLGMDTRKPRVAGVPGSLWRLKNGHLTRGGHIQRSKSFVPTYNLPVNAASSPATGGFSVTGGSAGQCIASVVIDGINLIGSSVFHTGNNSTTATAIVTAINNLTAVHRFTASADGPAVLITAPSGSGAFYNGHPITITLCAGSDVTVSGDPYIGGTALPVSGGETVILMDWNNGTDGAKTATDKSGNGHIPTFLGGAEIDTAIVKYGASALLLDGTNSYVWFPDSGDWTLGPKFTVEAWIYLTGTSANANMIAAQYELTGNQRAWQWAVNSSLTGMSFDWSTTGVTVDRTHGSLNFTFSQNTWYHVAVSRDVTGKLRFYVNGCKVDEYTDATSIFASTARLHVGVQDPDNPDQWFPGNIDDFRITQGVARYTTNDCFVAPTTTLDGITTSAGAIMNNGSDADNKTFGLHAQGDNLFVFGGFATPAGMPSGVVYQRLPHKTTPDATQISRILDTENFDGKIYAIAEFTDGTIYHYYNGVRVTAWDNIAASIASNNSVASALRDKIDLHPDFVATVLTDTVTIEAATAGLPGFTISALGQNFGSVNDQKINLTQIVAAANAGSASSATGTVTITGGTPNTAATGSFDVATGGGGDTITSMKAGGAGGTELLGATVNWTTSDANTATLIRDEINANTSAGLAHGYSATAASATVTVTAPQALGADVNTLSFTESVTGTVTIINKVAFSGGVTNALTDVRVDGVSVIAARVNYAPEGSNTETAIDLAAAINAHTSSPNYTATSSGNVVTITSVATGSAVNGYVVSKTEVGNLTAGTTNMQGGSDSASAQKEKWTAQIAGTFEPADIFTITLNGQDFTVQGAASGTGTTALTFKKKLYSTALSLLRFSAINNPTQWEQPAIGAGYVNFSNQDSGSETLTATGIYQGNLGVFARDVTQIEFVDVDEEANTHLHTVRNIGTRAHRSVVQFGNTDLFFLDELSGVRSLRARDSSNSPQADDVGTPIDDFLLDYLDSVTEQEAADAVGLIGEDGRYWLSIKERVFVFSFFKASKISAWSYYEPKIGNISAMVRIRKKIYLRSDDVIYLYGGDTGTQYPAENETPLEIQLPFIDLDKAAHFKTLIGMDISGVNTFECNVLVDPNDETVMSTTYELSNITYPNNSVGGLTLRSSHFAPKLVCKKAGNAELHNLVVHYQLDEAA